MFGVNIFKNHIHDKKYSNANQKLSAISHFMMLIQLFACVHPSYLLVLCGVCVFFSYSFYFVFFKVGYFGFSVNFEAPPNSFVSTLKVNTEVWATLMRLCVRICSVKECTARVKNNLTIKHTLRRERVLSATLQPDFITCVCVCVMCMYMCWQAAAGTAKEKFTIFSVAAYFSVLNIP